MIVGTLNYESDREQHTLIITSAGDIHSAHYTCIHRGIAESSYYLEVIRHETKKLVSCRVIITIIDTRWCRVNEIYRLIIEPGINTR